MKNSSRKWFSLFAMSLGVFMGLLDVTVVNVALPTMQKAFNEPFTQLQWVLNAYYLSGCGHVADRVKNGRYVWTKKNLFS